MEKKKKIKKKITQINHISVLHWDFLEVGGGDLGGGGRHLRERDSLSKNQERDCLSSTLLPAADFTQSWIFPLASDAAGTAQLLWQDTQTNSPKI